MYPDYPRAGDLTLFLVLGVKRAAEVRARFKRASGPMSPQALVAVTASEADAAAAGGAPDVLSGRPGVQAPVVPAPNWWARNKGWALPAGVVGGGLLAGGLFAAYRNRQKKKRYDLDGNEIKDASAPAVIKDVSPIAETGAAKPLMSPDQARGAFRATLPPDRHDPSYADVIGRDDVFPDQSGFGPFTLAQSRPYAPSGAYAPAPKPDPVSEQAPTPPTLSTGAESWLARNKGWALPAGIGAAGLAGGGILAYLMSRRNKRERERDDKSAADQYANMGQHSFYSAPLSARRELTDEERAAVEAGQRRWLPRIFDSYATPPAEMMASPGKTALLAGVPAGVLGALAGGAAGHALGGTPTTTAVGAGVGGLGAGGLAALIGYKARAAANQDVEDMMRRNAPGATKRDLLTDPVYREDTAVPRRSLVPSTYPYMGVDLGTL